MLDFKGALIRTYRVLDPEMAETQNYLDIKRWLADGYIDLSEELELHILNFKLCRQNRDVNADLEDNADLDVDQDDLPGAEEVI